MTRVFAIIALVGLFTVTGIAGADDSASVRHPAPTEIEPVPADPTTGSVVVETGDHLWKISADHLGAGAADGEIAPYWRHVVEVNTPRLRSGDPDLIYPGEIVDLPATP